MLVTTHCAADRSASELVELPASEERALRDQIDSLAVDEAKCEHAVDLAQDNFATSKAAYEALLETDANAPNANALAASAACRWGCPSRCPLCSWRPACRCSCAARVTSLSFTALGIGLVVFSLMLAAQA